MEAYWDCRGGISGHMTLAALCHLGLDVALLEGLLCGAGIECRLDVLEEGNASACGMGPGRLVTMTCADARVEQSLSSPAALREALDRVRVSASVRAKAVAVLDALLNAEAHAQQVPPEHVRLTEGEGARTLLEMLGVPFGLEMLGIQRLVASPLPWCTGGTRSAGGVAVTFFPRPAAAHLMEGKPIFPSMVEGELVTVLGAALLHALADDFQPGPQGRLLRVGTGYGDSLRLGAGLRLWLIETSTVHREMVSMLESHVDHLSGEELGIALQELSALPDVLDVLWLPGIGKKNRPAGSLRVLCLPHHVAEVERAFFAHTHSLGVRCQHMERAILPRAACTVTTRAGGATGGVPLRAKRYTVDGVDYVRVECDALRAAAQEQGSVPLALARGEMLLSTKVCPPTKK